MDLIVLDYVEAGQGPVRATRTEGGDAVRKVTDNKQIEASRTGIATSASKRGRAGGRNGNSTTGARARKSIEQLAAEQGVKPTTLEDILGKGADLWKNDQEFEHFVDDIYARRREDRELAKP